MHRRLNNQAHILSLVKQRQYLFHPLTVLLTSLLAAAVFAVFVTLFFEGEFRWFLLYYVMPIGIPFVAFLFDRAERYTPGLNLGWLVDLAILIPALTRVLVRIPLLSGHALFLVYCLFSSRSKVARISAFLVLLQVIYLKLFVTYDHAALFGGMIAGGLAAIMFRRLQFPSGRDGLPPHSSDF